MIKSIVFNIEGIADMQKILKIQCGSSASSSPQTSPLEASRKRTIAEDIAKKYTNIKVSKVSVSPEVKSRPSSTLSPPKPTHVEVRLVPGVTTKPPEASRSYQRPPQATTSHQKPPEAAKSHQKAPDAQLKPPEPQRSFMCISCSQKFNKFSDLETHFRSCDPAKSSNQQFKCFCGKLLSSKKDLSQHIKDDHKQSKQRHLCNLCKKVFSSLSNLQNHKMLVHKSPHGALKATYSCHECKTNFNDLQSLTNHRTSCKQKSNES